MPIRKVTLHVLLYFTCILFSNNAFCKGTIDTIAHNYATDTNNSIYIAPNIDQEKLGNFIDTMRRKFNIKIDKDDVVLYFDETLFGSGKEGVALTNDELICNIMLGFKGKVELEKIKSVTISGFLNRTIDIRSDKKRKMSIELTQGNEGAEAIVDILQEYIEKK